MLEIHRYDDRESLERAVRRRDVAAGVVIPAAVEQASTEPTRVGLIGPPEVALPGGVRAAVEGAVAETAATLQLGDALLPGGEADTGTALVVGQLSLMSGSASEHHGTETQWGFAEAAVLGTLVLFVGTNTMGGSGALADLRELGILARARTTPTSPLAIAVGFGLGLTSYALCEAVLMLVTGRLIFGISWASWPGLLVAVVVLAFAAGGLGVVTGTFLPSAESGTTVAGPVGFLLGMVGGCLWPLEIVGPTLDRLGHLTPHAWAVEALQATGIGGAGVGDIVPQLGVLLAMAGALFLVGGRRVSRIAARA
jgi:ABC-2 type transport system permease protein